MKVFARLPVKVPEKLNTTYRKGVLVDHMFTPHKLNFEQTNVLYTSYQMLLSVQANRLLPYLLREQQLSCSSTKSSSFLAKIFFRVLVLSQQEKKKTHIPPNNNNQTKKPIYQ